MLPCFEQMSTTMWEEQMSKAKSYQIPRQAVWEAYKRVKSNQGAAGIDEISIQEFEKDLKNNLYRIWNRMSSGSYFPPPAKLYFEPLVEPYFHPDSYGYRPKKSAIEAVQITRTRCWKYNWVLEFDIKGLFDNINHKLLMKAVRKHTDCD